MFTAPKLMAVKSVIPNICTKVTVANRKVHLVAAAMTMSLEMKPRKMKLRYTKDLAIR